MTIVVCNTQIGGGTHAHAFVQLINTLTPVNQKRSKHRVPEEEIAEPGGISTDLNLKVGGPN